MIRRLLIGCVLVLGPGVSEARDIDEHDPDIVVFHVFADNDFGDVVRNRLFELDANGALVRTNLSATLDPTLESARLLITRAARKIARLGRSEPAYVHGASVDEVIEMLVETAEREYAVYDEGGPRTHSHFADHYDIDIALFPAGRAAREKSLLMEQILERARATAAKQDVEFVVLIQPSSRDLTQNLDVNYIHLERFSAYREDRLSSIVDDICSRHGIHRINLYPVFQSSDPPSLFFVDNDHWNDAGQALAARHAAEYIQAEFLP